MEQDVALLVAAITLIVGASVTYAKTFGPYQSALTEMLVTALNTPSKYKAAVNLGVGVALAGVVTVVAAWAIGNPVVIAAGLIAGLFGSIEAQRVHDTQAALSQSDTSSTAPPPTRPTSPTGSSVNLAGPLP
jgi:hypothetical protein